MSIFDHQAAIKITFDKPIVTDPCIVTGVEYYNPRSPTAILPIVFSQSSANGNQTGDKAFDGLTTTEWLSTLTATPQWCSKDFGADVTISKLTYIELGGYRVNSYEVQGSNNGSEWNTVHAGNFANVATLQEVTFAPATYRYWRLACYSKYGTYYAASEVQFLSVRNTYDVTAWAVSGSEYAYQPEGAAVAGPYTIRKVTKTPDNMSVILWLDMFDRMRDPAGQVTVTYDKLLGNLIGPYSAQVESFSVQFSPGDIIPYSNPHGRDNISALANMTVSVMEVTYKYVPAESDTFLAPDQDNPYMDESLSAQANMTVVVTKVGDQPL